MEPAYLALYRSGDLERRAAQARDLLERCTLCPLACRARRLDGQWGICRTGERARLAGFRPHLGEEPCLSGSRGSGAIFFGRCNLRCIFCQNWEISQADAGRECSAQELAGVFLHLQAAGCHNLNLVSPSHVVPQILAALQIAVGQGLRLPLVYNSGGYDAPETLALLDGVVDIYLPDMKFADAGLAQRYSGVRHYPRVNQAAVLEMQRQVGDLVLDDDGLAVRGLIVRHLVLPHQQAGTRAIVRFLAEQVSSRTALNLMGQYQPAHQAGAFAPLSRPPSAAEVLQAFDLAREAGLHPLNLGG